MQMVSDMIPRMLEILTVAVFSLSLGNDHHISMSVLMHFSRGISISGGGRCFFLYPIENGKAVRTKRYKGAKWSFEHIWMPPFRYSRGFDRAQKRIESIFSSNKIGQTFMAKFFFCNSVRARFHSIYDSGKEGGEKRVAREAISDSCCFCSWLSGLTGIDNDYMRYASPLYSLHMHAGIMVRLTW